MDMKRVLLACAIAWCVASFATLHAQAPATETPAAAAPSPITDADIKNGATPKPEEKAVGDPAGTLTGTAGDIPMSDPKKGLMIGDVVTMLGQNLVATNFVWTLVTGFLVMFMQAG